MHLASFGLDSHPRGTKGATYSEVLQLLVTADLGEIWLLILRWEVSLCHFSPEVSSLPEKKYSRAFLRDAGKTSKHIPRLLLLCWYCIASCDPLSSQQCIDFRLHRLGGIYFRARLYLAVMSTAANYKKLSNALWKCNSCCSTQSLVYYKSALLHVHTTKIKYNSNHYIVQGIWDIISPETRRNSRLDKLSNFARFINR